MTPIKQLAVLPYNAPIAGYLAKRNVSVADPERPETWDALILLTPQISESTLRDLFDRGIPIAGLVPGVVDRLAEVFGDLGVTLAGPATRPAVKVFWEDCATHDFITDREHRLITLGGNTLTALHGALDELIELA